MNSLVLSAAVSDGSSIRMLAKAASSLKCARVRFRVSAADSPLTPR
jgi:hypothetical protein